MIRHFRARLTALLAEPRLWRWLLVGFGFLGLNLLLLYLLVDVGHVPFAWAPLFAGEVSLVSRYLVNDRWVFGHRRPSWRRLGEYHGAVALGFVAWWITANLLHRWGVPYLLASVLATGASVLVNLLSNFLLIWRRPAPAAPREPAAPAAADHSRP